MTRTYKRKHLRNPDRRMAAVARLRSQGLSLRQIGERMACSYMTVKRDLDRWEREHANVSHLPVTNTPPGGKDVTPECDSDMTVIQFRRA
jgi:IS30 family transposase